MLLQSGLDETCRPVSMERNCFLRNVGNLFSDGKNSVACGGIWNGDILVADVEDLESLDLSGIHARRLNAKEGLMPKNSDNFKFPIADGTVKLSGRDQIIRKCTLIRDQPERDKEFRDDLRGELDALIDDSEARNAFWSIEGNCFYRHHVEPRVKLHVPKKEIFPILLRYIDVIRRTHTTLDVLQESQIDDFWNFHCDRNLSNPWTGVTQFTRLNEKPLGGYMWSSERLAKFQAATRPDHLWPEIWSGMSKSSATKGKAAMGYRETEARQCAKVERHLFY